MKKESYFRAAPDCPQIRKMNQTETKNKNKHRATNLGLVSCQKHVRLWLHASLKYLSHFIKYTNGKGVPY